MKSLNTILRSHLAVALLAAGAILGGTVGFGPAGWAAGTVQNCTEGELRTALNGGGNVSIECNGTINLTGQISINTNTTIDAPSDYSVTLSGGGSNRVFYVDQATLNITNLTVTKGVAQDYPYYGGGIYIYYGNVNLTNSAISGNSAGDGGGIIKFGGNLTLTNSTVSGNSATYDGGGIYNVSGGTVTLDNSTVSSNSAKFGSGGGIYITSGTATLTNSTVSGNSDYSSRSGGIAISGPGSANLINSTISANRGGIYTNNTTSIAKLTNSTVSSNVGNGIHINYGNVNLINSTVSNNQGYGIFISGGPNGIGTATLTNSIVANNSNNNCNYAAYTTDYDYNLDSGSSCGFTQLHSLSSTDPLLGPLANNGGPTQTHALLAGSPAINRIPSSPSSVNGCGTSINTDQRGVSRPQPQGGACDIGAFEYDFCEINITSLTATSSILWPPNHQMIPVTIYVYTTTCNQEPTTCKITDVTSNEAVNGIGDGNTAPDWEITGDLTVNLRAERAGNGSGREYTIAVQCTDASGKISEPKSVIVRVPHD